MSTLDMDISSGNVAFDHACTAIRMRQLLQDDRERVRQIKKLQTPFSVGCLLWHCPAGSNDPDLVSRFIKTITALEELSVINYMTDTSALWPAIFHHAASLNSLAIHTPLQKIDTWTPSAIKRVADGLPQLRRLELDISLDEAEKCLKDDKNGGALTGEIAASVQQPSVLDELAQMSRLETVVVNINLQDAPSAFAGEHTWNVFGFGSFPPLNAKPCKELARTFFDAFYTSAPDSSLGHLVLRFVRRHMEDRGQYSTVGCAVHVRKDEDGDVVTELEDDWKLYLSKWPSRERAPSNLGYRGCP